MKNIIEIVKEINKNTDEIDRVASYAEESDRFAFTFRGYNFKIWRYWSHASESEVWLLEMNTNDGSILFSTEDYDLDGYQSYFSTLHRNVSMKLRGFDKAAADILNKKK